MDNSSDIENEIREVSCADDTLLCFVVVTDCVLWITRQRLVYVWDRTNASDPVEIGTVSMDPFLAAATPDGLVVLLSNTTLGVFQLDRVVEAALYPDTLDDEEGESEDTVYYTFTEIALKDAESIRDATHMSVSPDGSLAAVSCGSELVVIPCDSGDAGDAHFSGPHVLGNGGYYGDAFLHIDCRDWYNERGCARTCFASPQRLFVVSHGNHLVCVQLDSTNRSAFMIRDGHVVTRAHHITCMGTGHVRDSLVLVGLSDGTVKVLQAETLEVFRTFDIINVLEKYVRTTAAASAALPWAIGRSAQAVERRRQQRVLGGPSPSPADAGDKPSTADENTEAFYPLILDVAVGAEVITIALPDAVVSINKNSMEIDEDHILFTSDLDENGHPTSPPWDVAVTSTSCGTDGSWASWSPFTSTFQYYVRPLGASGQRGSARQEQQQSVDIVHASQPLRPAWLQPFLLPSDQPAAADAKGKKGAAAGRAAPPADKPVTFGHPIRSSGYAEVPWSVQQDRKKRANSRKAAGQQNSNLQAIEYGGKQPYSAHPLVPLSSANRTLASHAAVHRAAVLATAFTGNGSGVVTASGDGTGYYMKLPVSKYKGEGIILKGHKSSVLSTCANLSLTAPVVSTGSTDGTIMMWKPQVREAPFITHAVPGGKEVKALSFFYLDKFLLYTSGSMLSMCQYAFDKGGGEFHRARNESALSAPLLQHRVDAQSITAMSAINHFTSSLVVMAASNKQVSVFDVSCEQSIRVISDAHSRAVHHVTMCSASRYANCSSAVLHCFATAGMDSSVRLWDLRQDKPVRQFSLHRNQSLSSVGLSLDPTGAMLAVGSEDRSVVVYDVGMAGTPLDVLKCQDVPTALAWHPVDPVLVAGLASGAVSLFAQK